MIRPALAAALAALLPAVAPAEVQTRTVEYKDGDTTLKGYLAYDAADADAADGGRPGVVVVPEWWGLNDYPKTRARELAEKGYVAFVADMYGDGFSTDDPKVAGERSGAAKQAGLAARAELAVEQLKSLDGIGGGVAVDDEKIAAIGFCFGGTTVLEMARAGQQLAGVVSFHGGLDPTSEPAAAGEVKTPILVLHGGADPLVPPEQVTAFMQEMLAADAPVTFVSLPGAKHAFTNPDADEKAAKTGMDAIGYDKAAEERSFAIMNSFFDQVFGNSATGGQGEQASAGDLAGHVEIAGRLVRPGRASYGEAMTLRSAVELTGGIERGVTGADYAVIERGIATVAIRLSDIYDPAEPRDVRLKAGDRLAVGVAEPPARAMVANSHNSSWRGEGGDVKVLAWP